MADQFNLFREGMVLVVPEDHAPIVMRPVSGKRSGPRRIFPGSRVIVTGYVKDAGLAEGLCAGDIVVAHALAFWAIDQVTATRLAELARAAEQKALREAVQAEVRAVCAELDVAPDGVDQVLAQASEHAAAWGRIKDGTATADDDRLILRGAVSPFLSANKLAQALHRLLHPADRS